MQSNFGTPLQRTVLACRVARRSALGLFLGITLIASGCGSIEGWLEPTTVVGSDQPPTPVVALEAPPAQPTGNIGASPTPTVAPVTTTTPETPAPTATKAPTIVATVAPTSTAERTPDGQTEAPATRVLVLAAPLDGATIGREFAVRGHINLVPFEKTLSYRVYDASGNMIGQGPIMTDGEYGGPGTFDTRLTIDPSVPAGPIRIEVQEVSMRDGSVIASASANVTLKP